MKTAHMKEEGSSEFPRLPLSQRERLAIYKIIRLRPGSEACRFQNTLAKVYNKKGGTTSIHSPQSRNETQQRRIDDEEDESKSRRMINRSTSQLQGEQVWI